MRCVLFRWLVLLVAVAAVGRAHADRKPNVVLIMADDLGAECLGCYGGTTYETPHLDALAEEGVRFTNAYSTPLCTPTRVQIMTGQYPFRNGWTGGIWNRPRKKQYLDPERFNFGHMMQEAGYATAVAGKWQLARFADRPHHAKRVGFDAHSLWTWLYDTPADADIRMERNNKPSRFWGAGVWQNGELLKNTRGKFGPDIYTNFLIDFMKAHQDERFFVYFPMALVHWPFVPTPGMEGDKDGTRGGSKGQRNFEAMVRYMDRLVGRMVRALEEMGLRERTLILFTGDNGTARSLRSEVNGRTVRGGKGKLTEAGTRVPLIANWKGTAAEGVVCRDPVDLADVLPTLAALSGGSVPEGFTVDGRSFLPQIRGKEGRPRKWVFCQLGDDWFIRGRRWRVRKDGTLANMEDRYDPKVVEQPEGKAARAKKRLRKAAEKLLASE